MNVKEIVKEYLEKNGYDGLYYPGECACLKDDLFLCENCPDECEPGYLTRVPEELKDDCDFYIGPKKEKEESNENTRT